MAQETQTGALYQPRGVGWGVRFKRKGIPMASSPITSWQIDGETVETVTDFIFLGSKITADGDLQP